MIGLPEPEIKVNPNGSLLWDSFLARDYEVAAANAAKILQDSWALDAIHVAGLSLVGLNRMEEGFDWLCASLSLANAKPDWYANAAIAMMQQKDFIRAMLFVVNGLKDYPDDIRLSYMRGLCMCHAQSWEQAIEFLNETLAIDPTFYHANMSKGFSLHMLGRYDEAIDCYNLINEEDATEADYEEVINNHACVLLEMNEVQQAWDLLDGKYPNSTRPGTVYNKSFLQLGFGNWPYGWQLYRERQTIQVKGDRGIPTVEPVIAKTLDEIEGKDLFFFHEQGLGDTIQFCRYAKLIRPYCKSMVIAVPRVLSRLMECYDMDESFTIVCDGDLDKPKFQHCDIAMPMLDAPYHLEQRTDNIPAPIPYFKLPQSEIDRHQLPDTCKPMIGLVWAGASRPEDIRAHSIDRRRSVPFEMLEPILKLSDRFQFVSLQLPNNQVEDRRILQPITDKFDVLDTACLIKQLDLVITIDSAIAHVAGALGKPTWMLSRHDACWRWYWDGREDTDWYPSMRIFRQKSHNTWPEVIERVRHELQTSKKLYLVS